MERNGSPAERPRKLSPSALFAVALRGDRAEPVEDEEPGAAAEAS